MTMDFDSAPDVWGEGNAACHCNLLRLSNWRGNAFMPVVRSQCPHCHNVIEISTEDSV